MSKITIQSQTALANKLKYNIKSELAKFDSESAAAKRKEICEACGLNNKSTLSEWENIKADEPRQIPFDAGLNIARIVGCQPRALINN